VSAGINPFKSTSYTPYFAVYILPEKKEKNSEKNFCCFASLILAHPTWRR
jgi:hypothetical protein